MIFKILLIKNKPLQNYKVFSKKIRNSFLLKAGNRFSMSFYFLSFFLILLKFWDMTEDWNCRFQKALDQMWTCIDEDNEDCDIISIATSHKVGKSTLYDYKKKGIRMVLQKGRKKTLPDEYEDLLANRIKDSPIGSSGWDASMIRNSAFLVYNTYIKEEEVENSNPKFSDKWLNNFCARHNIGLHTPVEVSKDRKEAFDRSKIITYLSELSFFIEKNNVPRKNIWTCDETTSIPKGRPKSKVYSAVGKDVFVFKNTIRVPKFSMLCCIGAAGDQIPPFFVFPCSDETKRKSCLPVIGPPGRMSTSIVKYSSSGCMTKELFTDWLLDFFEKKVRSKVDSTKWVLLIMDNCSVHFDFSSFKTLHTKKIAVAFFPANATHFISPLDVSIYRPFKNRLLEGLKKFSSLQYGNIASWIEPSYENTFRHNLIKNSFISTGIWSNTHNGPNINWKPSQFQEIIDDIPKDLKKANQRSRRSMAISLSEKKLEKLIKEERDKIDDNNKVIGGPKFIKNAMAGKTIDECTLSNINQIAIDLTEENTKVKEEVKKEKIVKKEAQKEKIEKEKEKYKERVKNKNSEISKLKKMNKDLTKKLNSIEKKYEKEHKQKNDHIKGIQTILTHVTIDEICAGNIIEDLQEQEVNLPILGKRKAFKSAKQKKFQKKN